MPTETLGTFVVAMDFLDRRVDLRAVGGREFLRVQRASDGKGGDRNEQVAQGYLQCADVCR